MTPHRLRPEEPDFVARAPVRLVFAREVAADPQTVFRELSGNPEGWPRWFKAVSSCSYEGEGPHGVGTRRLVRLRMGTRFTETVLAWDEGRRLVYRADTVSSPGLRAQMEEWLLSPAGSGTRVQWSFTADAVQPLALFLRAARPGFARSFSSAVRKLDRMLAGA